LEEEWLLTRALDGIDNLCRRC